MKKRIIETQRALILDLEKENFDTSSETKKLNLMIKDYEDKKDVINVDNLHLYYEFMNDKELDKNSVYIWMVILKRFNKIKNALELSDDIYRKDNKVIKFKRVHGSKVGLSWFGVKDNFEPLEHFIKEIKISTEYKIYLANKAWDAKSKTMSNWA